MFHNTNRAQAETSEKVECNYVDQGHTRENASEEQGIEFEGDKLRRQRETIWLFVL